MRRPSVALLVAVVALVAGAGTAAAVEYRLRVASVHDSTLGGYLGAAEFYDGASGPGRWQEFRWDGRPGERSVWVVAPSAIRYAQLERLALRGRGPLRQFRSYPTGVMSRSPYAAVQVPLSLLWSVVERGTPWEPFLSQALRLDDGIAALVGANLNLSFADQVYLLVTHAEQPSTYEALLVWLPRQGNRTGDAEAPGFDRP